MNAPVTTTTDNIIRDKEGTAEVLRQLGYHSALIRMAIEHADYATPQDVPSFLRRHTVIGRLDGYQVIGHPEPAEPRPDLSGDCSIREILRAIAIVDQHLDDAAPEIYRPHPGASAELNEARALANRWRRIAAGPVSEAVESADALNLATGGNPRKGVIGDDNTILGELGDTASSALLAIQSITKDTNATWAVFITALAKALSRVPQGQHHIHESDGTVEGCPGCFGDKPGPGWKVPDGTSPADSLARTFQGFIDAGTAQADRTAEFTIDGAACYRITPGQRDTLMAMAPDEIRALNTPATEGDPS